MITVSQIEESNAVVVQASDRLIASDYEILSSKTEEMISRFGKINMLVELREFKGWAVGALWQDLKFDIKHFKDLERLAVVGEAQWEKGLAIFSKPFTSATVRYFDVSEYDEAMRWVVGPS